MILLLLLLVLVVIMNGDFKFEKSPIDKDLAKCSKGCERIPFSSVFAYVARTSYKRRCG
jgi:hypothetical protein